MAQKKEFRITTPRGSVFTSADANGSVTAKIEWAPGFAQRKAESFSKAQAGEKLSECENTQTEEFFEKYDRYNVQEHGNRQQRRYYNKQQGKKKKQHYKG